jgi:DNA polymerase V
VFVKGVDMSFTVLGPIAEDGIKVPKCSFRVPAGFPSPAADHIEKHISLDEILNIRAPHVYLISIAGDSMLGAGIFDGDLAIVDRALEAGHNDIVVALLNNEPVCKRLCKRGSQMILLSENPKYPPRYVLEGDELAIWGVITNSVRRHV